MNTWHQGFKYYKPKEKKPFRYLLGIIIIVGILIYLKFNSKTVGKTDIKDTILQEKETKESNQKISEENDDDGIVESAYIKSEFNINEFYNYIKNSNTEYVFTEEDSIFEWNLNKRKLNIEGKKIQTEIQTGDSEIEINTRNYLEDFNFIINIENTSGTDAGESIQAYQNASFDCLIETYINEDIEKSSFSIICGNI